MREGPIATLEIVSGDGTAVLQGLTRLREQRKLVDVVVQAGGTDFHCHRAVLAATSEYWDALFASGMRDAAADRIVLDDVLGTIFSSVLDFIYEGRCVIEQPRALDLLEAAARLQVRHLVERLSEVLVGTLCADNALQIWQVAERLALASLVTAAVETALGSVETLAIADATLEQMATLLCDDRLAVPCEEDAFTAVTRWFASGQHTVDEPTLLGLLRHVRFALMPSDFIQASVRAWPVMQSTAGRELLLDALVPAVDGTRPKKRRGMLFGAPVSDWQMHDSNADNMQTDLAADGRRTFRRDDTEAYGVAVGMTLLNSGRHQWTVTFAHVDPDLVTCMVGFAAKDFEFGLISYSSFDDAAVLELSNGELLPEVSGRSHVAEDWDAIPVSNGEPVHVHLDMDNRTLSFAIGDGAFRTAFSELPAEGVYPLVASGEGGDESIFCIA